MFQKHYFYDIIISTRPDGSQMQFEQGVLDVPFWWTPKQAFQGCVDFVNQAYEVKYSFHFKEFRRIK